MHGDKAAVARSACTSANGSTADRPSPALGQGSHEWLNGGWTSTEYIAAFPQYLAHGVAPVTNDVRSANHILPRGYREGFIYLPRYGHPDRQQSEDAELSDQATELVRPLDLGFHYGGQRQVAAPGLGEAVDRGFVTLAPATFMLKPVPAGQGTSDPSGIEQDGRPLKYELISGSASTPGRTWQTDLGLFAVSAVRPSGESSGVYIGNNQYALCSQGSRLLRYDFANDEWVTMLSNHRSGSPPSLVTDTYALTTYQRYGLGYLDFDAAKVITDMAGVAISSDAQIGAGDQYLAIAVGMVKYNMTEDAALYPEMGLQYIYLFYKSHLSGSQWQVEAAFGDPTDLSGSTPVVGSVYQAYEPPGTAAELQYWMDATHGGELAITHDRSGRVHILWTKDTWSDRDELWHTSFIHGDTAPQTDNSAIVNAGPVFNYNVGLLSCGDRLLGAAWDDDSRMADPLRVVWPEVQLTGGLATNSVILRAARYSTQFRAFQSVNLAALTGVEDEAAHRHNSIATADFTGRDNGAREAWMQGAALRTGAFTASQAVGGGVNTWRCTLDSGNNDSWDTARLLPGGATQGQGTVAARGIRVPRYAALGDELIAVDGQAVDGSVLTDGGITAAKGEYPAIRTNRGLFVDQYMTARSYALKPGTDLAVGPGGPDDPIPQVLVVTPLRP
jgi:hypothetical protein